jgi:hypothetical protein
MSTPANYALVNPTTFPHSDQIGMPPGARNTSGPGVNFGSGFGMSGLAMPGTNFLYAPNHMGVGVNDTNQTVNSKIYVARNDHSPYLAGCHQICFVHTEPQRKSNMAPAHTILGWSQLNRLLWDVNEPAGRQKYQDTFDGQEILNDWKFYGVQANNPPEFSTDNVQHVQTFHFARRVRCPNYWAAQGALNGYRKSQGTVQMGDHLFILLRRYYGEDPLEEEFGTLDTTTPPLSSASVFDYPMTQKRKYPSLLVNNNNNNNNCKGSYVKPISSMENYLATLDKSRLYWALEPYTSPTGTDPPECLYMNQIGRGSFTRVGLVTDLFGNLGRNTQNVQARAALHPKYNSDAYIKSLMDVPELEIQLRVYT